jgi:hypothetical protein
VEQGESGKVVRMLRDQPGVTMVDVIEGPPDVVMVVEARGLRRLAELTVKALGCIENMTTDLQLLPVTANGEGIVSMTAGQVPKNSKGMKSLGRRETALTRRSTTDKNVSIKLRRRK